MTKIPDKIKWAPAPIFSGGSDCPSLATIYMAHYQRLKNVVDATKSGNKYLIKCALDKYDKYGYSDEPNGDY